MDELITRFWQEIAARPDGPFAFRFYLQPAMAIFFAVRDGLADARHGKPAYLWAVFTNQTHRRALLKDGWRSIGRVFVIAMVMDLVYQLFVLHGLRPVETVIVATLLAIVPYAVLRGPVNRVARSVRRSARPRRAA